MPEDTSMVGRGTVFTGLDKALELENNYRQEQRAAWTWQPIGKAPVSTGPGVLGYSFETEAFSPCWSYPQQFGDKRKMFEVQVQKANFMRCGCIGRIPGLYVEVKGLVESMLGCEVRLSGLDLPSMECLWVLPSNEDLKAIVERGLPPLDSGLMPMMMEFTEYFREHLPEDFYLTPHGILSPFATAAAILGARLYTELYDRPEQVHQLLDLITETTVMTQNALYELSGLERKDEDYYFGSWMPGPCVGGDDVVCLSREMIGEFEVPYIKKLSQGIGRPLVYHYCPHPQDTREHYTRHPLDALIGVPEIVGFNSQPLGYWVWRDDYETLRRHSVGVQGYKELSKPHSESEFTHWVEQMHDETYGKSGICLTLRNVSSPEETRRFKEIWDAR